MITVGDSVVEIPKIVPDEEIGRDDESTGCDIVFVVDGTSGDGDTVVVDSAGVDKGDVPSVFCDTVVEDGNWVDVDIMDESVICGGADEDCAVEVSDSVDTGEDTSVV